MLKVIKRNKTLKKNLIIEGIMTYDYTLDENLALVKYPGGKQISYNATNAY